MGRLGVDSSRWWWREGGEEECSNYAEGVLVRGSKRLVVAGLLGERGGAELGCMHLCSTTMLIVS